MNSNRCRDLVAAPPIGLAYVATATADAGHDVRFTDLLFSRNPERDIALAIKEFNPDVVGLSVRNIDNVILQRLESYIGGVESLIRAIRDVSGAKIVIGGPAISILGHRALDSFDADFAAIGEGETVMPALLEALSGGANGEGIDGIYCRQGSGECLTPVSRLPQFAGSGLERWVDWILDVPMLFQREGQGLAAADGSSFRRHMAGPEGPALVLDDWAAHCSSVFTEVRCYSYIEVRCADLQPDGHALAVPAFWTAILYDDDALSGALEYGAGLDHAGWVTSMESAARHGLRGALGRFSLGDIAARALSAAVRALDSGLPCAGDGSGARHLESLASRLSLDLR